MKRTVVVIAVKGSMALIVVWASLAAIALERTRNARIEAEQCLKEVTELEVGRAGPDKVTLLVNKYHGTWRAYGPFPPACCGPASKIAEFVFDNHWEHWTVFNCRTRFVVDIGVNRNGVCDRSVSLLKVAEAPVGILVQEYPDAESNPSFYARLNLFKTITTLTGSATPVQRAAAYWINLDCLSKLTGCRDAREMAPGVWQKSRKVGTTWESQWGE